VTRIRDRLLTAVDLAATFVLALECAIVGVRADLDLFGLLVLAFVGSVGGGVMRDLLLGEHPPAAFRDWRYAGLAAAATAGVSLVSLGAGPVGNWTPPLALDLFEAVGLALAVVAGTQKSLDYGLNSVGVVIIATVNGCGGGILRDVLTAQVPHVLRADFYATVALLGSALMVVLVRRQGVARAPAGAIAGVGIVALRAAALLGQWSLPHLR
jgi:uncharacterized membrane protein YeiH